MAAADGTAEKRWAREGRDSVLHSGLVRVQRGISVRFSWGVALGLTQVLLGSLGFSAGTAGWVDMG